MKNGVLRNLTKFTGKHLCQSLLQTQACSFIKKDTLTQVFFCEFCEISKNVFFTKHLWTTASVLTKLYSLKAFTSNTHDSKTLEKVFVNFGQWSHEPCSWRYVIIFFVKESKVVSCNETSKFLIFNAPLLMPMRSYLNIKIGKSSGNFWV